MNDKEFNPFLIRLMQECIKSTNEIKEKNVKKVDGTPVTDADLILDNIIYTAQRI